MTRKSNRVPSKERAAVGGSRQQRYDEHISERAGEIRNDSSRVRELPLLGKGIDFLYPMRAVL